MTTIRIETRVLIEGISLPLPSMREVIDTESLTQLSLSLEPAEKLQEGGDGGKLRPHSRTVTLPGKSAKFLAVFDLNGGNTDSPVTVSPGSAPGRHGLPLILTGDEAGKFALRGQLVLENSAKEKRSVVVLVGSDATPQAAEPARPKKPASNKRGGGTD